MLEPLAIVIVGGGNGVPGNRMNLDLLARCLGERYGHPIVEYVAMTSDTRQLFEAFDKCVRRGASSIFVVPYVFELSDREFSDLASAVSERARKLPGVRIVIAKPLGFDESLVSLVDKRIRESEDFPDIRKVSFKENQECERIQRTRVN